MQVLTGYKGLQVFPITSVIVNVAYQNIQKAGYNVDKDDVSDYLYILEECQDGSLSDMMVEDFLSDMKEAFNLKY
jgi:hypothetical protein